MTTMPRVMLLSTWSFGLRSNGAGWPILAAGGSSLDAVEAVGRYAENDLRNRTVGVGGYPDASGHVSLDASIMLSPSRCGAVANLRGHGQAVSIARRVMECTPHVLLAGAEADAFADAQGFDREELLTEQSRAEWAQWHAEDGAPAIAVPQANVEEAASARSDEQANAAADDDDESNRSHDTIGVLAIDASGVLAGCCTTSGLRYKLAGRVGDSPIVGHGLYVDATAGAAVATGHGELVMGVCGTFLAVDAMRRGASVADAAREVIERIASSYDVQPQDQVGIITIDAGGDWSAASLRAGFSVAVRTQDRDELVSSPQILIRD